MVSLCPYGIFYVYKDKQSFPYKYWVLCPGIMSSLTLQSMITYNKHSFASILNSIVSSVLSHWVLPHHAVVSAPFEKLHSWKTRGSFHSSQNFTFLPTWLNASGSIHLITSRAQHTQMERCQNEVGLLWMQSHQVQKRWGQGAIVTHSTISWAIATGRKW